MKKINLIAEELSGYDAVVITGASSGIGEAFAALIRSVSDVKICNISRTPPSFVLDTKRFLHVPCDLKEIEKNPEVLEKVLEFVGTSGKKAPRVLLINNSGFGAYGVFPEPSIERNCEMIDLNVRALTYLCGKFMPILRAGKGSIINIASTAAWLPCPQLAVYAATKAYVMSFSLALSYEMKKFGGKCLCVCPGPTSTKFFSAAGFGTPPLPTGFGHKAVDVAQAGLGALANGKNLIIVGFVNNLQALLTRVMPVNLLLKISGAVLDRVRSVK